MYIMNNHEMLVRDIENGTIDAGVDLPKDVRESLMKKIKPDPGIYQDLLEKYDLRAEECLFFDDREDNVEAARELGIQAVQFESYEQAKAVTDGLE
jgi:putative hydrolase of the HAD superfamily